MPSIGAIENTRIVEGNLEQVTSIIQKELNEQISESTPKTTTDPFPACGDKVEKIKENMAPNRNGEVEGSPGETPTRPSGGEEKWNTGARINETKNGNQGNVTEAAEDQQKEIHGNSIKECDQVRKNDGGIRAHGEMRAEEKRQGFRNMRQVSSLEILGLSKNKKAKIPNQGSINEAIKKSFEEIMRRRNSAPASLPATDMRKLIEKRDRKGTDEDSLVAKTSMMSLEDGQGQEFGRRVVVNKPEANVLTARGPMRPMQQQSRMLPYPTAPSSLYRGTQLPLQGNIYQPVSQQISLSNAHIQTVRPTGKKVAHPGMTSSSFDSSVIPAYTVFTRDNNQIQPTMSVSGRIPVETSYNWGTSSPSEYTYIHDPISPVSIPSPEMMQTAPSPIADSQYPSQHSPTSIMSPGSQSMSPSPKSPYSVGLSPQSVQSVDSGISSPPRESRFTACNDTNFGSVIVKTTQPQQQILQIDPQQSILFPEGTGRTTGAKNLREDNQFKEILENIILSAQIFENTINGNMEGGNVNTSHHLEPCETKIVQPDRGRLVHQDHVFQPADSIPISQQHGRHHPVSPCQNVEELVNKMPLDILSAQDEDGDTALHIAISQGDERLCHAIIKRLVANGRMDALNIRDKDGQTPLYIAVVTNQPDLVFTLFVSGADAMIPNKDNVTPLHYAATKGFARALLAIGCGLMKEVNPNPCNINVENKNGMSPLQCAIEAHGRYEQIYDGNLCQYVNKLVDSLDTVKILLQLGADAAFKDTRSGYTVLHFAVELAPNPSVTLNTHLIKEILQSSSNAQKLLAMKTYADNTPLHLIAGRDYDEDYVVTVIDHLISYGAEIMVMNGEKMYPHDLVNKNKRKKVYARLQGNHLQGK